jgi:hypothetical protein
MGIFKSMRCKDPEVRSDTPNKLCDEHTKAKDDCETQALDMRIISPSFTIFSICFINVTN